MLAVLYLACLICFSHLERVIIVTHEKGEITHSSEVSAHKLGCGRNRRAVLARDPPVVVGAMMALAETHVFTVVGIA